MDLHPNLFTASYENDIFQLIWVIVRNIFIELSTWWCISAIGYCQRVGLPATLVMPMVMVELIGRVNLPSLSCNGVTASSASEQEIKCELLVTVIALQCLDAHVLRESHFHQLFLFSLYVFLLSIILHPLFCRELVQLPICFILACNFCVLWIIWLWTAQ